jgi:hypothetical protein
MVVPGTAAMGLGPGATISPSCMCRAIVLTGQLNLGIPISAAGLLQTVCFLKCCMSTPYFV